MSKQLNFSVPVSYNDFLVKEKVNANLPGIYIWGFPDANGNFVPYYVGKSESSVYLRIISHFEKMHKLNTYILFDISFYKNLQFNLSLLPRKAKPYLNLHKGPLKNHLVYYNNTEFLSQKYSDMVSDPSLLKKELTSQGLDSMLKKTPDLCANIINQVFNGNNLFVSYMVFNPKPLNLNNKLDKKIIKDAETFVKFNLNERNVISDSGSLTSEIENMFKISLSF